MYASICSSYFPFLSCFLYHQSKPSESPNSLECILQQFCFYLALRGPLTEPSIPVRPSVRPHSSLFFFSLIFSSYSFSILLLHRKKHKSKLSESPACKPPTLLISFCSIFVSFFCQALSIPRHSRWKRDWMLAL